MLVGRDTSDSDFNTILKTGGEKTHTLSVEEMPSHNHTLTGFNGADWYNATVRLTNNTGNSNTPSTSYVGGSQAHNNLQPYIVVYRWRRIA